ncbi:MAG: Crp/Fnr family transcriptional regulator [Allomuricauda sp.]
MTYVRYSDFDDDYLWFMEKRMDICVDELRNLKSLSAKALERVMRTSESVFLPKGTTVFHENQQLKKLYCIKEGACKFSTIDKSGKEHILRFLGKGEIMGKRSLISNKGARVSATTLTDTELYCLDRNEISDNLRINTDFCNDLLQAMVQDINLNQNARIAFSAHKGIKERLINLLIYLAEKFGQQADGKLEMRLRREDMASVLGTSPEYIINLLTQFKRKGALSIDKGEIVLGNMEKLKTLI